MTEYNILKYADESQNWCELLDCILFLVYITKHLPLKCSPFHMMYIQKPVTPFNMQNMNGMLTQWQPVFLRILCPLMSMLPDMENIYILVPAKAQKIKKNGQATQEKYYNMHTWTTSSTYVTRYSEKNSRWLM